MPIPRMPIDKYGNVINAAWQCLGLPINENDVNP
jgi:hypothetical protein